MAGLRVFVSSTCYDLSMLRAQLRIFIQSMGYDPIMSDYEDVLYDPRIHTHTSCVDEVSNCDVLILIIGSRFGGKSTVEALNRINFDILKNESLNIEALKKKENLSVTQLEVLKAVEESIPTYTFIDKKVWHDHELYEKNKDKDIINEIFFPSIEKQETAKFVFNFINFVRLRTKGNNIFTFEKIQDIEEILRKQWSSYFQRLLNEQRYKESEIKRIDFLSEQFEDLKTAILTSIGTNNEKEIARGIVRYRKLFDFIFGLKLPDFNFVKNTHQSWENLIEYAGIKEIIDLNSIPNFELDNQRFMRARTILLKEDGTYYEYRFSKDILDELALDWDSFILLPPESRDIIIDALSEMQRGISTVRYVRRPFEAYIQNTFDFKEGIS
jgi:hypothetical protein